MHRGQKCPLKYIVFFFVILFLLAFILIINIFSRPGRNIFLTSACVCLVVFFSGLSLYYLKVGGFSNTQRMLYISGPLHVAFLEKLPLSFERLACFIISSRLLFCYFYLMEGINSLYRTKTAIRRRPVYALFPLVPVLVLITLSFPSLFRRLFDFNYPAQKLFAILNDVCITLYIGSSIILYVTEYLQIQILYLKRRFRSRMISFILLGFQYTMFSMFEPITVYQNYGSIKLPALFSFYSIRNKSGSWILFICLFTASMLILMIQSIKYCHFDYDEKKKELVIEERINGAALSSSILIHGIKNQLLSSEILINTLKANDCVKSDMEVNEKVNQLSEINSFMLRRLNILYRSFIKINTVLKEVRSSTVFDLVKDKLGPDCDFISYSIDDVKLLCDPDLLSEAIYNIVRNAVEATEGKPDRAVEIALRNTRTRILITISDNGSGISAKSRKDIFNPFFSTKNSQTNWGLGLSYANMVVRKHRGSIQFESSAEKGTVFLIDLPRVEV